MKSQPELPELAKLSTIVGIFQFRQPRLINMGSIPIAIERVERDIVITWNDNVSKRYSANLLRKSCPCALCKEKNSQPIIPSNPRTLPVISMAEAKPLEITRMHPIGNYAYNIHFSDGHTSGIYEFQMLYELGQG